MYQISTHTRATRTRLERASEEQASLSCVGGVHRCGDAAFRVGSEATIYLAIPESNFVPDPSKRLRDTTSSLLAFESIINVVPRRDIFTHRDYSLAYRLPFHPNILVFSRRPLTDEVTRFEYTYHNLDCKLHRSRPRCRPARAHIPATARVPSRSHAEHISTDK
jgi:hypothetical protein